MEFGEYLDFIKPKVNAAAELGNYNEAIRLISLLRTVCTETIEKLEKARDKNNISGAAERVNG